MNNTNTEDIKREFTKSMLGMTGIAIIVILIIISAIAVITIPTSTFQEWNNPEKWLTYPKTSIPIWVNYLMPEKTPEHKILESQISQSHSDNVFLTSQQFLMTFLVILYTNLKLSILIHIRFHLVCYVQTV